MYVDEKFEIWKVNPSESALIESWETVGAGTVGISAIALVPADATGADDPPLLIATTNTLMN